MKSFAFGLTASALVAAVALAALPKIAPSSPHTTMQGMEMKHKPVDHGHEALQPAYFNGRLVQFKQLGAAKDTPAAQTRKIFEVEYPNGWQDWLARPLCNYCDHFGDGQNAWDFHDHILDGLPNQVDNSAKAVYWNVFHIQPAYSKEGNTSKDANISRAYAALLPAQSSNDVKRLTEAKLPDGTLIARVIDVKYTFNAVLNRR